MKKNNTSSNAFKSGSYSAVLTVVVILIVLFVNILFSALPTRYTELDLSSKKLYSVTATTKAVLNSIDEEVNIYQISQSGEENRILSKLIEKYTEYSSKINYKVINPDVYPTFAGNYTSSEVQNNDVIVESGERYKYISFEEIYDVDTSFYYTNGTYKTYFDGEAELTSAIDYVTKDKLSKLYVLTGHGEAEITDTLSNAINKANIEYEELSLISAGAIPDDCDILMLWGLASDPSTVEVDMIKQYVDDGGKLMIGTDINETGLLPNYTDLLNAYGIELVNGIVFEQDSNYYIFSYPYIVIPTMGEHDITKDLIEEKYNVILPILHSAYLGSVNNANISSLLETSATSYAKDPTDPDMVVYQTDDDYTGPFYGAAAIESTATDSKIVWFGTTAISDATYNAYSSGANMKMVMNAFSWLSEENTISIVSKSVDYDYLTISESQAKMLKAIMLIAIPLIFLALGIVNLIFRRKLR